MAVFNWHRWLTTEEQATFTAVEAQQIIATLRNHGYVLAYDGDWYVTAPPEHLPNGPLSFSQVAELYATL